MRRPTIFQLLASCMLLAIAACEEHAVECVDTTCASGYACAEGVCAPVTPPTTTGALGRYTSTARHPDGRLFITTYDATHKNLVLRTLTSEGQQETRVIDGWNILEHGLQERDRGQWTALAVAADGDVHLSWYDADAGSLRYGRLEEGALDAIIEVEVVDGEGPEDRGTHGSLAVSSEGVVHLAYRDQSAKALRYARRDLNGVWTREQVPGCAGEASCPDALEDYGAYASLVLIGGAPRVVFYDQARGDLKLAQRDEEGQWSVTTLDGRDLERDLDTGDVGRFASAAVDAKQRLGVAYYDSTRGALRYLFASGASPTPVIVDDGTYVDPVTGAQRDRLVGQHAELLFDPRDGAVILYLDAGALTLKRARLLGDQVIDVAPIPSLRPGAYISATMSPSGVLLGAYGAWPEATPGESTLVTFTDAVGAP